MKTIITKIICFLFFHKWIKVERPCYEYILTNEKEVTEVLYKCKRCKKESNIKTIVIKL